MNIDRNELDRYITGNYGEDQFRNEDDDPLAALFEQHPEPWTADDNRDGHAGLMSAFDAAGRSIVCTGDMEGCGMADIELAYAIAAIPDLIALAREVAKKYSDAADWKDARSALYAAANDIMLKVRAAR